MPSYTAHYMKTPLLFLLALAALSNAAPVPHVTVSVDTPGPVSTLTTPQFSITQPTELLLAFISADHISGTNTTVTGVTGSGLRWSLVQRSNAQEGDSEIWMALAPTQLSNITVSATLSEAVVASLSVQSYTGASGCGAVAHTSSPKGAPFASLVTTKDNSLVVGIGNDFDLAIPRVLGRGQVLIHQDLTPTDDTYWLQTQAARTANAGTTVIINDTAPTGDRYNLSICEVLASANPTPTPTPTPTPSPTPTPTPTPTPSPTPTPTPTPGPSPSPIVSLPTGWNLVYDFTPTTLNQLSPSSASASSTGNSIVCTKAANGYQNGVARFVDQSNSPNPFSIATQAGIQSLHIQASETGGNWTSGIICTEAPGGAGFSQQYGYWEAKIYSPTGTNGFWPAFWFLGPGSLNNGTFTEFDDFEEYGVYARSGTQQTEESVYGHGVNPSVTNYTSVPTLQTAWHIFSAWFSPTNVVYYIDGNAVATFTAPTDAASLADWDSAMYAMINLGMGPTSYNPVTSTSPCDMYIAYVRCWARR
jgi:glycosyl hydrolase family 16